MKLWRASSTISHIIHLCRIPFILYFGEKKIAWKITLSDRRLRIPQLRFSKQQRSLSIHEITDGCKHRAACGSASRGHQPPRLHLLTCVETHRRNWGNDEIIANMFMGTTTKKSIHKGFALIWLDLTKAGLFTVTQEALGVTCLWSPAWGRARRQREPSSILLPSNWPAYAPL